MTHEVVLNVPIPGVCTPVWTCSLLVCMAFNTKHPRIPPYETRWMAEPTSFALSCLLNLVGVTHHIEGCIVERPVQ